MKKLLALVLCVMLFVSVIPTSAFATSAGVSGSAIDLSPAYTARNTLFSALGILGEAHFYKNAILGIRGYETKDTKALFETGENSPIGKLTAKLNALKTANPAERTGVDYYGLAKIVAPIVVEAYNMAGNIVVGNVADKIAKTDSTAAGVNGYAKDSMVGGVLTQVNNIIAEFKA